MTYTPRVITAFVPEQGPDLVTGVVTMDQVTFITPLSLSSEAFATSRFNCRALLESGSP